MKKVVAIPAGGARLTGPVRVKLTKEQYQRRAHILGPRRKNGIYELDGGQVLSLKRGEEVAIDELSKLDKSQFEEVGKGKATAPEPGTGKGALRSDAASDDDGAGTGGTDSDDADTDDESGNTSEGGQE